MPNHRLINADCLEALPHLDKVRMIFLDPPDNIGLGYKCYNDKLPESAYTQWLGAVLRASVLKADIVWLSYNSKWTFDMGVLVKDLLKQHPDLEAKANVQTFTFYQHNKYDLGQAHRPLLRLRGSGIDIYPDQVRIPSWRQLNGDKRANPNGKVPGDHFNFTRVVGNSKQRRAWHPTQLNEELVERCVRLSCKPTDSVMDLFAGTGTLLRVCKRTGNPCTLVELDPQYCLEIVEEHGLKATRTVGKREWSCAV